MNAALAGPHSQAEDRCGSTGASPALGATGRPFGPFDGMASWRLTPHYGRLLGATQRAWAGRPGVSRMPAFLALVWPWPLPGATAWMAAWGWECQKANPEPLPPDSPGGLLKPGKRTGMLLLQVIAGPRFTWVRLGDHDPLRMHPCRVWGNTATWLSVRVPSRAAQRAAGATPGAQHMTEIIRSQKPDVKSNQVAIFAMVEHY